MHFLSRVMLSVAGPTAALLVVSSGVVVGAGLVKGGLNVYFEREDALHHAATVDGAALQDIARMTQAHQAVQAEVLASSATDQSEAIRLLTSRETPSWRELRGKLLELKKQAADEKNEARLDLARFLDTAQAMVSVLALLCLVGCSWAALSLRRRLRSELGGDPAAARDGLARV